MAWKLGEVLARTAGVKKAWPFIVKMEQEGYSASKAYNQLRGTEYGVRKQALLDAFRAIRTAKTERDVYMPSDTSQTPETHLIPFSVVKQKRKYKYLVNYDVYNYMAGAVKQDTISLYSDQVMDEDYILREAAQVINDYEFKDYQTVNRISLDSITQTATPVI